MKLLLDWGADIHTTSRYGTTTLICACQNGHLETVSFLLDKGAYIHAIDNYGRTALIWGCLNHHVGIVELLLKQGAPVNVVDNDGQTALSIAQANGHKEIVRKQNYQLGIQNFFRHLPALHLPEFCCSIGFDGKCFNYN